jgi:hypothetical protein
MAATGMMILLMLRRIPSTTNAMPLKKTMVAENGQSHEIDRNNHNRVNQVCSEISEVLRFQIDYRRCRRTGTAATLCDRMRLGIPEIRHDNLLYLS